MITEADIKELQEIFREDYGQELSKEEALEYGPRLIDLFRVIVRPIPEDK